jgi:DNA transformation protein
MVTAEYREFVLEQLSRSTPATITDRAMFGGVGFYADGLFFGLADDDVLYFKVDRSTRPYFEALGMRPFLPFGDPSRPMQYYQVPADVLEDTDRLGLWVDRAVRVARSRKRR